MLTNTHIFIISWPGQHEKAVNISNALAPTQTKITIVYSDPKVSLNPSERVSTIRRPNDLFFGDKFQTCLEACEEPNLFLIHADCSSPDWLALSTRAAEVKDSISSLGVWVPRTSGTDWIKEHTHIARVDRSGLSIVAGTDALVVLLTNPVITRLKQADIRRNKHGYGIDLMWAAFCLSEGLLLLQDDSAVVNHSAGSGYDKREALSYVEDFLSQYSPKETVLFSLIDNYHKLKMYHHALENSDPVIQARQLRNAELAKTPSRTHIINQLIELFPAPEQVHYLEIGVRDPADNYDKVKCLHKTSVDPGVEFKENPVDFPMTSDEFFAAFRGNEILEGQTGFNVIFIDGLHLADQARKDIDNAVSCLDGPGFVVVHDCNPPTEYHAREDFYYHDSPARRDWNGTTWKAFCVARKRTDCSVFCIDSDWGVGVIFNRPGFSEPLDPSFNQFFEYKAYADNREHALGLVSHTEATANLKAIKEKFLLNSESNIGEA